MIFPIKRSFKVFGTDSFDVTLNWKDPDDVPYPLSTWLATWTFFLSKEVRTVVKTVNSTTVSPATRIELSDEYPNIYVFVQGDETQIGSAPDFTQEPGYFILDLSPQDTQQTIYRLMEGAIHYKP